jgi:hypothetical protein
MPAPVRGCGGVFTTGECDIGNGCGRVRCIGLGLDGTSGGVRKGGVLALDSEGEDGSAATMFDGGRGAFCVVDEGTDVTYGGGEPTLVGDCSTELRGASGDPDLRPRARVKGEEG